MDFGTKSVVSASRAVTESEVTELPLQHLVFSALVAPQGLVIEAFYQCCS